MYCSECKLQVADDDVTVCPVCQGPLQPDVKTEEVFNDAADKGGSVAFEDWSPETRIDEKFSVYENPDQNFDFNPEEFGLQSSEHEDPAEKVEDIQVLAELWDDEDVEADLEGVLAEAFILDEAEKDIDVNNRNIDDKNLDIINEDVKEDVKDDVMDQDINVEGEPVNFENVNVGTVEDEQSDEDDEQIIVEDEPVEVINVDVEEIKDIDVEDEYVNVKGESFYVDEQIDEDKDEDDENNDVDDLSFDLGLGEDDLISGQPEVLPVLSPKAAPSRSSRTLLLLFLLLVVIGVGGGAWFYMQNSGTKPKSRVVTSKTQSQPEKAASLTPVKKVVATEKVAAAESTSEVVKSEVVQEKAISGQGGDDSVEVEAVDFKEDKAETLSQKVGDGLAAAVVSQSAGEG
ncbi:MAG: hypothetical protein U9Q58_02940, partial [Pseudomonadota bacterium]|nr:hypothetical protein [Pseudomonadota bacterium]